MTPDQIIQKCLDIGRELEDLSDEIAMLSARRRRLVRDLNRTHRRTIRDIAGALHLSQSRIHQLIVMAEKET